MLRGFTMPLFLAGAMLLGGAAPASAADGGSGRTESSGGAPTDRWVYAGEVYLWGAGLGGTTVAGDDIDVDFTDLIKKLDFGIMGTFAASKGEWTLFADLIYLDVSDDARTTANIIGVPIKLAYDASLQGFTSTFGAAHSLLETDTTRLNLLAGARYLSLDLDLAFSVGPGVLTASESLTAWDGIVGMRGKTDLNPRWYLTYYADVGAGGSDLTWQALAAVNYRFGKVDAVFGYRYLDWEFDGRRVLDDINLSGPYAGVNFRF